PSVEAGDVLAGILAAAARATAAHAGAEPVEADPVGAAFGAPSRSPGTTGKPFPGRHIHLTRGYRQSASLDLAPLAAAVREGDTAMALSLLRSGQLSGVHFHEGDGDPLQSRRDHLLK